MVTIRGFKTAAITTNNTPATPTTDVVNTLTREGMATTEETNTMDRVLLGNTEVDTLIVGTTTTIAMEAAEYPQEIGITMTVGTVGSSGLV